MLTLIALIVSLSLNLFLLARLRRRTRVTQAGGHIACEKCGRTVARYNRDGVCPNCE